MIIENNIDLLKTKCDLVSSNEADDLIKLLEFELESSNRKGKPGVGLAAPQIGIFKQAAIIRLEKNDHYNFDLNLINPEILKSHDLIKFSGEGCLSFPDKIINTERYNEINLKSLNKEYVATGLLSVACQHEIDHLNGILFFDRQSKPILTKRVGPNEKCICGSDKKYKKCCGR
jgi:peptide deformylase